jgi:EAL domain-containing protein (putative c-di-GMP-specific phosphodiesterase class I)
LLYQPVLDFASGTLAGAEALIRWRHPKLGLIAPIEFIPLVEETALTRPLTDWVLNEGIGQLARWRGQVDIHKLSINASARNLEESDLADRVGKTLATHGVDPRSVQLEFTETALVSYSSRALDQLSALKDMGVSIAIDDFGIGYSSLSYLQQLPASVLKIDQSFIRLLTTSDYDQKLVRAVIYMAHDLGYTVVAEGIEDREAYDMLAAWKCDQAQGYFISHPLPADTMACWVTPIAA